MTGEKVCPQCGAVYPASARFCETDGSTLRLPEQGSDLVGSVVADRYHVLEKLGEGGMGQVYLAEHVKMGRKSALKVMRPSLVKDVDAITRFNREAANASRISHPNVAAVYDFGETPDGLIYLAMELVEGRPLSGLLAEQLCLTPARAAEIVRQTADALAAAHDLGIVHRDLKPDNIMLARGRDGADLVKVVDFGIAKVADSSAQPGAQKVTKTGSIIGTPEYMSPEQLAGDPLDARSDVYALGLVAFAMLTGTLPFPSDSAQESLIMRLTERPRTLAVTQPGVAWPAGVQTALDGALERAASRRFQSAVDFARAFGQATAEMSPAIDRTGATLPMAAVQLAPTAPAFPATRVSGGVARSAVASSSRQPSRVSMLGGIAAVVVLGGFGYALTRGRTADPAASPSNADRMSRSLPPIPDTGAPAAKTANPISTVAAATKGGSAVMAPVVDVDKVLDSLEERAKADKPAAREVLRRLSALAPALVATGDSVHAALARFDAMLTLEDAPGACRALVAVRESAAGTSYQKRVDGKLEACP